MDSQLLNLQYLEFLENIERRPRYVCSYRGNDLDCMDETDFKSRYRLNKSTAEALLLLLGDKLSSGSTKNQALTPAEKLCIGLRYFATGSFQIVLGDLGSVSQSSACRAVNEVAKAIAELRPQYIRLPQTDFERHEVSQEFYNKFGFPGVFGALDCTLIPIVSPGGPSAEEFRCRKGYFALNVQTVCDASLCIRNIVASWPGSTHDSTIFDNSRLRAVMETDVPRQYHLLGDNGYSCRPYLMTPFLEPRTLEQERYNAAHIRARNTVERSYGLWKRRFYCLAKDMRCSVDNALTIIVACSVLHNIALQMNDRIDFEPCRRDHGNDDIVDLNQIAGVAKRNTIVNTYFNN